MSDISRGLRLSNVAHVRSHYLLEIVPEHNQLYAVTPNGLRVAQLNNQVNECLHEQVALQAVKLQALIHKTKVEE